MRTIAKNFPRVRRLPRAQSLWNVGDKPFEVLEMVSRTGGSTGLLDISLVFRATGSGDPYSLDSPAGERGGGQLPPLMLLVWSVAFPRTIVDAPSPVGFRSPLGKCSCRSYPRSDSRMGCSVRCSRMPLDHGIIYIPDGCCRPQMPYFAFAGGDCIANLFPRDRECRLTCCHSLACWFYLGEMPTMDEGGRRDVTELRCRLVY